MKKGLYAKSFGGGQVDITSGKFVFTCTEAYLIEDGKIGQPVKGAILIGAGAVLSVHDGVGDAFNHAGHAGGRDAGPERPDVGRAQVASGDTEEVDIAVPEERSRSLHVVDEQLGTGPAGPVDDRTRAFVGAVVEEDHEWPLPKKYAWCAMPTAMCWQMATR